METPPTIRAKDPELESPDQSPVNGEPFHGASSYKEPSYGDRDPIAAIATPLAESALALVRTSGGTTIHTGEGQDIKSGQGAIELTARAFSIPGKLLSARGNSVIHGWIIDPENSKKIDEVMVSVYRSPLSYTGEDGADISCHGGIAAVKAVMAALKKAGFREALPGEFTFRAFMNGKLDLTRAESVMELVSAKTNRGREQAVCRLTGALEKEILGIKAMLVEVLSGTEIYLDYSEDEFLNDEEAGRLPDRSLAEQAAGRLKALLDLWRMERIFADGALTVLAGRPNAGKSSLFNYLVREDRSIVTDVPGTTRDWIEALVSVENLPLRLADTAGLRDLNFNSRGMMTPDVTNTGEAERIGMQRSLELLERSDLVLYVIDGIAGITEEDKKFLLSLEETAPEKPVLVLWNKTDLAPFPAAEAELQEELLPVSAKTGEGIQNLAHSISCVLEKSSGHTMPEAAGTNTAGAGTLRQKELIDSALSSVKEALALSDTGEPLDIIAPLFRSAINALGEITGEVSTADILEAMFSRFCVGK